MTINLGAYTAEIFRAGIESIHRSQIEAGLSLALTRRQVFQHIVLKPAVARVWPSLVSQFILIMLTSSVCSFISVEELSGAAALIQSNTFRSLEVYILVTVLYLLLALGFKIALSFLGRWLLPAAARPTPASSAAKATAGETQIP
jgi:polar amino acid transport system permease protein